MTALPALPFLGYLRVIHPIGNGGNGEKRNFVENEQLPGIALSSQVAATKISDIDHGFPRASKA